MTETKKGLSDETPVEPVRFNIDPHLIKMLEDEPFFCNISRYVKKIPTNSIPTAGVTIHEDDITMYYNEEFFAGLTPAEIRGVLKHEFYHLIFMHVSSRKKDKQLLWNIGTDLAINSLLVGHNDKSTTLPNGCLIPGERPKTVDGKQNKEEQKGLTLADVIETLPKNESSEWYYEKIQQIANEEMEKNGFSMTGADSFDDHDMWEKIPDDKKDFYKEKIKNVISKAAKSADANNGWGSVPAKIREEIRTAFSNIIDWKATLRRFAGISQSASSRNSLKRINKKYPYIHPGRKKVRTARLAVAVDMSGSVGDADLELLFGELSTLAKHVSFYVIPFDTAVATDECFEWKKGQRISAKRTRCGGTNFSAPTQWVNKRKGLFDGMLILTDGMAEKPNPCYVRRGWVLTPNNKLAFPSQEIQIFMKK
tara:strand:+ start:3406 stop:4674 length:1269 start_codon:yes stop_codon:yes gene_type:complete